MVGEETFAPILYLLAYDTLDEATALYLRSATNTVNYTGDLTLAQGVSFL
ncbi:hypothetical protein [Streptomyces sp. NPDC001980]